jgi:S-adenosylmethionine decarboxylase
LKTIGRHLIAEYYDCDSHVLDDVDTVRGAMLDAATAVGATVIGEAFHRFEPQGLSGTVVIAESHLSIHTWPENGYVAVDIYTCGGLDPRRGFELLAERLGAGSSRVQEILRGLPEDFEADQTIAAADVQVITRTGEKHLIKYQPDPASGAALILQTRDAALSRS